MAISKERKTELVADYVDRINRSQGIILADYRGLTVARMTDLRQRMREVDGAFQVVKNTLFKRALEEAGIPVPEEHLRGTVAAGFCLQDPPPVAKVLVEFAKETQILEIQGAILGARFISRDAVKDLADLPSRDVLLAQLLGAVRGPMSNLVSTITAPLRELVQVLQARSEQGADEQGPMEAAA